MYTMPVNSPNIFFPFSFCTIQKTLKEFFPSWEHIRIQEEVIGFTCGLMKDPTPLVDHVYEAYVETFCNVFNPACVDSNAKTQRRLLAEGKDIFDVSLFNILYTESTVHFIWKCTLQPVCLH